ncbi:MAG: ATP-binding cassette domain-containing protein [Spirochaetes bacterium]|nr:ATP-binding cassette domain-containing protein [Spirochaetota bacterium]
MTKKNATLLRMKNIHVSYSGVEALRGVDFDVQRGEIHALVGEHRAGKSTLVKLLSGVVQKKSGDIMFDGKRVFNFTPDLSMKYGISMIYQDVQVIPSLSAVDNVFAGRMLKTWLGSIDYGTMIRKTRELFRALDVHFDIHEPLSRLTRGEQYMVELARAICYDPELIIFDEISNKLTPVEMEKIYKIILDAKKRNKSVVYITHNLEEIFRFADRVTILKDGYRRGTEKIKDLDKIKLIKLTYSFVLSRNELERSNISLFYFKQYNESIIKNLPIGVVVLDAEHKIYMINFAAIKNLGIESAEVMNKSFETLFFAGCWNIREEILDKIKNREKMRWDEIEFLDDRYLRVTVYPFHDDDYVFLGTILLIEDITKERQFKEYLLRTEKITSVENLAAGVAHEINNPLGIIQNYLEIIKAKNLDDAVIGKVVKIERELNRICGIVGNLLSFSKLDVAADRRVNLVHIINEVLALLNYQIEEKRITLQKGIRKEDVYIRGDENRLKQLCFNLLVNSIEAVVNEGLIRIEIDEQRHRSAVYLRIIDNGCGIPTEITGNIFEPFYSTKVSKKNTGLGLAICQHIADLHDGVISCASDPGKKTVFTVQFPLYVDTEKSLKRAVQ